MRGRKARTFCFRKTSFVHSRSGTYYALLLGYFGLKFLPDIGHCVYCVLAGIWHPNSSHKICNKFFIRHCQARKEGSCLWNCLIFFLGEYSSVWSEICRVLSQIQSRILRGISRTNYSGRIFQKFCWKPRLSSTETCEISPYFLQFYSGSVVRWKNSQKHFHIVVCTQLRRDIHKQITKRRCGEEKPGRSIFGKPVLFTLGPGHTTPYSLGILVWNFSQTLVIVSTEFWLRVDTQILSPGSAINFLSVTARSERKVRFSLKLFDFFPGEYSSVCPEICRVLSQIQSRLLRGIS